ncbi:hypothetical protein [Kitasatospora sp. NPDC092286]|uniref:hypothetical protein n=1 Tax=Kitasatospora sp. NPDC092286 TaxID=3364087 RepID=UPI003824B443
MTSTAPVTAAGAPTAVLRPPAPLLGVPDLAVLRFALLPGTISTVLTQTDPRSSSVSTSPLAPSVPATRPPEAAATVGTARAEVLLTDDRGRVLITAGPGPGDAELPGGPLLPHETPPVAAERHAKAATALAHLTPGRLLAIDWRPGTGPTYTYDHPPLTGVQAAALTADDGRRGAPRLLAPAELLTQAPADAQRVLTALRARVEGRTAELEHGRPRTPGVLDTHRILPRTVTTPAPWTPADRRYDGAATSVAGWLFLSSGLVVLHHDPVTGRTRLPGGPLSPSDADALDHALARTCAATVGVRPRDGVLIGHSGAEARLVATVSRLGPLIAGPCEPAVLRLLTTPEQAVELCGNSITAAEVRDALESAAIATGLLRQPVTLVPANGMTW